MRAHLDIAHEGTLDPGDRVRMQIDSNSTAFLMSMLTDLYSDQELAVIREYATNAADSHKAAGNVEPIEIELPTVLRPLFIVRDHGVGMSVYDIVEHFSKYGWSSKRDTDDEVGMLGLGCKSGLTYSSQFTLIAVKNGVKATVLVTRESDGAGAIQVIDTMSTTEPDGVEVQIPVRSSAHFNAKALKFFSFWEPGTVVVNGNPPEHIRNSNALVIDPDVILVKDNNIDRDYLVMGNVAYPTPRNLFTHGWHVVAWVPIGSVDFAPSREALQMNKRTTEAVEDLHAFVMGGLHRKAQAEIDAAVNHWYALQKANEWRTVIAGHRRPRSIPAWYYRNEEIPSMPLRIPKSENLCWAGAIEAASERIGALDFHRIENAVFLTGHSARGFQRADKERLKLWFDDQGLSRNTYVIAVPHLPHASWIGAKARVLRLEDLRSRYKPTTPPPPIGSTKTGYRVLNRNGEVRTSTELATHVVWIPADLKRDRASLMGFIGRLPDVSVVVVPKAQVVRFLKENPKALDHRTFIEAIVWCFATSVTPGDLAQLTLANEVRSSRVQILYQARNKIHDPELVELIDLCGNKEYEINDTYSYLRIACELSSVNVKAPVFGADAKMARRLKAVLQRYPLLEHLSFYDYGGRQLPDFVRYINLIHFSES